MRSARGRVSAFFSSYSPAASEAFPLPLRVRAGAHAHRQILLRLARPLRPPAAFCTRRAALHVALAHVQLFCRRDWNILKTGQITSISSGAFASLTSLRTLCVRGMALLRYISVLSRAAAAARVVSRRTWSARRRKLHDSDIASISGAFSGLTSLTYLCVAGRGVCCCARRVAARGGRSSHRAARDSSAAGIWVLTSSPRYQAAHLVG
jgi:hypothetical protein